MTQFERPNPDDIHPDAPHGSTGPETPPPPSVPYRQPPLPGETPQPAHEAMAAPTKPQVTSAVPGAQLPSGHANPTPAFQPGGQQPPYPPQGYPPNPSQGSGAPQPKGKVWPWVLGGCLLIMVLLGLGSCVGFQMYATFVSPLVDRYEAPYDSENSPGYDAYDEQDGASTSSTFTFDQIKDAAGDLPNISEDGRHSPGTYVVGEGEDLEPGLYYLEGSQTEEGSFYVFEGDAETDAYTLDRAVIYFGNYFTELKAGDIIVFEGSDDLRMYSASNAPSPASEPFPSGLYRVGVDLPAGTYAVTVQNDAANVAQQESAVFVMKDLDFNDDSVVETKYVIAGGSQTIDVQDGQYVELYAATMEATSTDTGTLEQ